MKTQLGELRDSFRLEEIRKELAALDAEAGKPEFWNDPRKAAESQRRRSHCSEIVTIFDRLATELEDAKEFAPMAEQGDQDIAKELEAKLEHVQKSIEELEFRQMLGGELDGSSAILTINSGAGGTGL
jgi:peptide chain release factor 2